MWCQEDVVVFTRQGSRNTDQAWPKVVFYDTETVTARAPMRKAPTAYKVVPCFNGAVQKHHCMGLIHFVLDPASVPRGIGGAVDSPSVFPEVVTLFARWCAWFSKSEGRRIEEVYTQDRDR